MTTDHDYLSTACWHAEVDGDDSLHGYCQSPSGRQGPKTPGTCKWCAARCRCRCHHKHEARWRRWLRIIKRLGGRRRRRSIGGYPSSDRDVTELAAPVGRARSVIVGRTPDAVSVPKDEIVPSAAVGRGSIVFGPPPGPVSVMPPVSAPKDVLPPSAAVSAEEDGTDG